MTNQNINWTFLPTIFLTANFNLPLLWFGLTFPFYFFANCLLIFLYISVSSVQFKVFVDPGSFPCEHLHVSLLQFFYTILNITAPEKFTHSQINEFSFFEENLCM